MPDYQHARCRRSRLFLLLAGVLYLCGTAADPLLHLFAAEGEHGAVVLVAGETEGPGESSPSVPHNESQCLLCKVAGSAAAPDGAPVLTDRVVQMRSLAASTGSSRAPPAVHSAQPRAPPHA